MINNLNIQQHQQQQTPQPNKFSAKSTHTNFNGRYTKNLNKSTCSLNLNGSNSAANNHLSSGPFSPQRPKLVSEALLLSQLPATNLLDIDETDLDEEVFERTISPATPYESGNLNTRNEAFASPIHGQAKIPSTPILVNSQMAAKFAQLERTLEMTKAQNNSLLEQQVILLE